MPETVEKKDKLSSADLKIIADFILSEHARRKEKRKIRELQWADIDRQIAMTPRIREISSGQKKDWYPDVEPPLQFNAFEVIAADARRLKFPRGTEWYSVIAELSDKYIQRWQGRRERHPLIAGTGFSMVEDSPFKALAQQVELDQPSANTIVHAVIDHYHRMYDFRSQIDLFDADQIKYGTGVVRVRPVRHGKTFMDYRGQKKDGLAGPAVIPCSIKHTYLDDTPHAVMHEGVMVAPLTIRSGRQRLDSMLLAAKKGGVDRGWMAGQIAQLKPLNNTRHVEFIEAEGDFVIPKTRGSIYLENFLITIGVGQGDGKASARVVRMRKNATPFHSYVPGHYMRDDVSSPYGASPLMKGRPIQEAVAEVFNDMLAAARLSADPVIVYDRYDQNFAGSNGPEIFPGAMIPADSPNAVEDLKIGDVAALTNSYLALTKQYEDMTGVNDARRGAPIRSHTTTGGIELEASRGIARTDDFVTASEQGPMVTILNMEYAIIKDIMKSNQSISVGAGGIEGWISVNADDLADNVAFQVHGSSGALNERERASNFLAASNFVVQLAASAQAVGKQLDVDLEEIATEAYTLSGVQNAGRFVGQSKGGAGEAPAGPGVSGGLEGSAEDILAALDPKVAA